MVASINKIVEENSDKSPHLTQIREDGTRTFMKLLPADMSHGLLQKMANKEI